MILAYNVFNDRACTSLRQSYTLRDQQARQVWSILRDILGYDPKPNVPYEKLGITVTYINHEGTKA